MTVSKRMQESIMVHAELIYRNTPTGRESVREAESIENRYASYGGNVMDLPWNRDLVT